MTLSITDIQRINALAHKHLKNNEEICGVVINSGLSTSRPDEPASLEWCGM